MTSRRRLKMFEAADKAMMKDAYPLFRREWDPKEELICICGNTVHCGKLLFMVRIKESEKDDVEAIKKDYCTGLNKANIRLTLSQTLRKSFPQMLIAFYEKCTVDVASVKKEDSKAEEAAAANLVKVCATKNIEMNAGPLYRDVMKDLPEQLATLKTKKGKAVKGSVESAVSGKDPVPGPSTKKCKPSVEPPLLDEKTKKELLRLHKGKIVIGKPLPDYNHPDTFWRDDGDDRFGLPMDYGETDYSDYCSTTSNDDDDDD